VFIALELLNAKSKIVIKGTISFNTPFTIIEPISLVKLYSIDKLTSVPTNVKP
jgi:hypothetical protein